MCTINLDIFSQPVVSNCIDYLVANTISTITINDTIFNSDVLTQVLEAHNDIYEDLRNNLTIWANDDLRDKAAVLEELARRSISAHCIDYPPKFNGGYGGAVLFLQLENEGFDSIHMQAQGTIIKPNYYNDQFLFITAKHIVDSVRNVRISQIFLIPHALWGNTRMDLPLKLKRNIDRKEALEFTRQEFINSSYSLLYEDIAIIKLPYAPLAWKNYWYISENHFFEKDFFSGRFSRIPSWYSTTRLTNLAEIHVPFLTSLTAWDSGFGDPIWEYRRGIMKSLFLQANKTLKLNEHYTRYAYQLPWPNYKSISGAGVYITPVRGRRLHLVGVVSAMSQDSRMIISLIQELNQDFPEVFIDAEPLGDFIGTFCAR